MVTLPADKFVELLRRSGLIENEVLDQTLEQIAPKEGEAPFDSAALAEKLIEAKLLTPWQRDNLLQGKHRGFFLGKYKLLRLLGTGGMSTVYLAENMRMHHPRALKVLPKNRVNDSSYLARFEREAQAAVKLDHKNIVRMFDIDKTDDNIHYLVMEYVEGRDLQSIVHDDGPLDYDIAADYIRQAADGLEHAHNAGLIHRDIKPANLFVDQKGVVKVLDMGLARWEQDAKTASLTIAHEENVLGTADYLPPEQAKDSHTVDKRADIYSLGCTLYFLLTGHAPFPEGTLAERIQKHVTQMPKSVYEERPDAPPALVEVCLRMMAKERDARFQSAAEVSHALGKWLESRGKAGDGSAARPLAPPRRSSSPPKPPRRGGANDDTVSNFNKETLAGAADPSRSKAGASGSQTRTASSILNREGSSVMGRGGAIVGRSGSHILGDPTLSTKSSVKGLGKSLPTAKPLMPAAEQPKNEPKGETLNALIEDALRERDAQLPPGMKGPQIAGAQSGGMRSFQPKPEPGLPKWFWYVLGGVIAAVGAAVGLVIALGH